MTTSPEAAATSQNLRKRTYSSLLLAPIVLAAVFFGDPPGSESAGNPVWAITVAAAALIGLYEWLRLIAPNLRAAIGIATGAALLLVLATCYFLSPIMALTLMIVLAGAVFIASLIALPKPAPLNAFLVALGLPYLGGGGIGLLSIRATPDNGMVLTLYLLAVVWATDIGGYVVGRRIGGAKLAPAISPGKTWAGFIGGAIFAMLAGAALVYMTDGHGMQGAAITALLLSLVAQMGDLYKSFFKRRAGVKDSGTLIPGHGGVLDRIDGLIAASMAFALLHHAANTGGDWW